MISAWNPFFLVQLIHKTGTSALINMHQCIYKTQICYISCSVKLQNNYQVEYIKILSTDLYVKVHTYSIYFSRHDSILPCLSPFCFFGASSSLLLEEALLSPVNGAFLRTLYCCYGNFKEWDCNVLKGSWTWWCLGRSISDTIKLKLYPPSEQCALDLEKHDIGPRCKVFYIKIEN